MSKLAKLVKKRNGMKAQVERLKEYLHNCSAADHAEIQIPLEKTTALWDRFSRIQDDIEGLEDGETEEESESERERKEFENVYFAAIGQARKKINDNQNIKSNNNEKKISVKLPTLNLQTFNGDYKHWLLFKDTFSTLVDSNAELNSIQKLQYLRSSVKGKALAVIQALETSAKNYNIAWQLLKDRFENKKLIVNTHVKALFELSPITKENSATIRSFVNNVRTHIRSLESLGEPVKQWGTLLIYLTSNSLNLNIRKDWELHIAQL